MAPVEPNRLGACKLANKLYFVSELTGLGAPTFTAEIGLFW